MKNKSFQIGLKLWFFSAPRPKGQGRGFHQYTRATTWDFTRIIWRGTGISLLPYYLDEIPGPRLSILMKSRPSPYYSDEIPGRAPGILMKSLQDNKAKTWDFLRMIGQRPGIPGRGPSILMKS